jgi:Protein of unknown function
MEHDVAADLFAACEKTIASLTEAEHAIHRISDEEERIRLLRVLSGVIADLLMSIRAPVVREYPDLEPPTVLGPPDTNLSEKDQELASRLTPADLELIDGTLLSECAPSWRKVARVIGTAMNTLQHHFPTIPDGYYAQRVALLVNSGSLDSQGNLGHMRFSEIRLPGGVRSAA